MPMKIELRPDEMVGGKYRIARLLGSGGVGTVYAAEHVETNKRVALKCVDASHALDPAAAERLVREAQAAARIRHPNVVDIYDVGREGKLLFLVMELLEGEPLSALIARRTQPIHKLIASLLPAMRGVAEAHRQGVVHRDIKPDNIFLARQVDAPEPVAKVLDFGISKLEARGGALRSLTADGFALGTPGYMAYEQALAEKHIDGRADVYAFGAILYEALTGKVPHDGEDFPSLVKDFLRPVPTPLALGAKVPAPLSALVMWAIERERDQRVSSMESLIRELEPFASERAYESPEPSRSVRHAPVGKTLAGPWGVEQQRSLRGALEAVAAARAAASNEATTTADEVPTTVEAVLWLKHQRARRMRNAAIIGGAVALVAVGFALLPEPSRSTQVTAQQSARDAASPRTPITPEPAVSSAPREASPEPSPSLKDPVAVEPDVRESVAAKALTTAVESARVETSAPSIGAPPVAPKPAKPVAPAPLATPAPPRNPTAPTSASPVPVPPKPATTPVAPAKPAPRARDFGIY